MATEVNLKKATFKHIESELYSYKDTLKEIDRIRAEIMSGTRNEIDENVGGNSKTSPIPGRPTERIATRLLTHKTLRNLEEIASAIEVTFNKMSKDHQSVIRVKYWGKQKVTWDDVAVQTNMHRNTAMKLRKDFVVEIADKIGWR
ncbi:transcriptional regulator [Radiobacillus sp. PE A8.2]|uniref:transcriptional regulator n=1 Tax=Radiobacillus sp. PE A8.2 TaxID=3380349 RepID=UPI00388D9B4C